MEKSISAYLLKLRRSSPFLATISLMANYKFDSSSDLFETDGKVIHINSSYFSPLTDTEKTGLLLHLTLHTALLHPIRLGVRDAQIWNIAADIVVNNIIIESGDFTPPKNTAIETQYTDLSVEQVYEALMHLPKKHPSICKTAMSMPSTASNNKNTKQQKQSNQQDSQKQPNSYQVKQVLNALYPFHKDLNGPQNTGPENKGLNEKQKESAKKTTQFWQRTLRKAEAAARLNSQSQGHIPAGLLLEIDKMMSPILSWRSLLWQFIVRTPDDYSGYDRRFIHRGLYIDQLESERLNVLVAIDTSGSIDKRDLTQFISELIGVASAYHFIDIELYYVDADIYGPYKLSGDTNEMPPQGGGGTSFDVFFQEVVNNENQNDLDLIVYFTDGYGDFPEQHPTAETMWVVTCGGLDSESFPFGTVARLSND